MEGRRLQGLTSRLLLLGASLLLTAGLLELGARVWLHQVASDAQFQTYASLAELAEREGSTHYGRFVPHRYLGYALAPGYRRGPNAHDALGYRGEGFPLAKPAGEFRIVALGGSTTYTNAVDDHREAYPHQLERELHRRGHDAVRVINAGVPGYTSWESLVNLQFRVLDLDPDLLLVYHGVNDAVARLVWPPSSYRGDNSGLVGPSRGLDVTPPWTERSDLLRIFRIRMGYAGSPGALERTFAQPQPTAYTWEYARQFESGRYPTGFFLEHSAAQMFSANDARYYRRNMAGIVALAQRAGVTPVLVSFAYNERVTGDPLVSEPFRAAIEQHNAISRELARRHDVPFFDFAVGFPKQKELWFGGLHLTRGGAALKARRFADFLESAELLPR